MTTLRRTMLAVVLLGAMTAQAQTPSTVRCNTLNTWGIINLTIDGRNTGYIYAGEFSLTIDGAPGAGYCVDLFRNIGLGQTYQANLLAAPDLVEWNAIQYVLANHTADNNAVGALIQLTLWKLVYGSDFVTAAGPIDATAEALAAEAMGKRLLRPDGDVEFSVDTQAEADGSITVVVSLSQNGSPVIGQPVALQAAGAFRDGVNAGVTDDDGRFVTGLVPQGTTWPITIQAEAMSRALTVIDAVGDIQQLVSHTAGESQTVTVLGEFDNMTDIDPRGLGFWKHQANVAVGAKRGRVHVDAETLAATLPLDVFGQPVETLDELAAMLSVKKPSKAEHARQHGAATQLNIATGRLGYYTPVNTDGAATWVYELLLDASQAFEAGAYETAKDVCESLNKL